MTRHAGGGDGARGGGGGGGNEEERREGVLSSPFFGERGGGGDPLSEWIEERQRAFRDFERSFHHQHHHAAPPSPLPLLPPTPSLFSHGPAFGGPSHILHNQNQNNYNSVDFPAFLPPPPINQTVIPEEDVEDLSQYHNSNNMLSRSNNGNLDRDLSPKARVTYDEGRFQVEFDVRDYRPEELSIKTEGDVLIVLAKHETKTEGGGSFVSKQFEQRFTLPSGVQPETITSSLAKDGTLTVTAPRQKAVTSQPEMQAIRAPVNSSSPTSTSSPSKVYAHQDNTDSEGLPHPRVKYDEDKFQIALDCQNYRPEELDVKVEGNTIIITAKQESKEAGGTRTRVFEQKFTLPSGVRAEKVASSFGKDGVLTITAPRANMNNALTSSSSPSTQQQQHQTVGRTSSSDAENLERHMDRVLSPSSWEDNFQRRESGTIGTGITSLGGGSGQPLKTHHSLFDRDVFGSSTGGASSSNDGLSKVEVDDESYRILVDVREFSPEELIIKTVGNTVHFEAKHEEKTNDGHSYTSRNISQSFTLPRGVDPESVTSSLSKEGTLTISAPLPPALKLQSNERLVPIKHR